MIVDAKCVKCGQPLEPGKIPCKASALDIRPSGTVVLELEATCPKCGGVIVVRLFLFCRGREEE